ncbi:MAG: hypothetical protein H7196_02825 [candidate division SR1 bacterium]|nr:hypothetical protein [candidate division SR1 bacterium]
MLTDDQINAHELFSEIAELVIGVPIKSLPASQQQEAVEGVKKYIKDFLYVYINETYGKFPAIRVDTALSRDKSIFDKFPETVPQLRDAFTKLVESL